MPHEFIIDRDLGKQVVSTLRAAGWALHTLPEVFGNEQAAMLAEDKDWIAIAGSNGWAALSKNHRISHNVVERNLLMTHRVELFALANGSLKYTEMAAAFLLATGAIAAVLDARPGGGLWAVHKNGTINQRWPRPAI